MDDLTWRNGDLSIPLTFIGLDRYPVPDREVQPGRIEVVDLSGELESDSYNIGHCSPRHSRSRLGGPGDVARTVRRPVPESGQP